VDKILAKICGFSPISGEEVFFLPDINYFVGNYV